MLSNKMRSYYTCPIDFIEKLPIHSYDINILINESKILKSYDWMDSFVQLKFVLCNKFKWHETIEFMPYTKNALLALQEEFPFNSVFYRYVKPNTCYNWHVDKMKTCLHIPLITNEGCKFVYSDKVFSMPADGSVYIVNNGKPHTFVNSGKESRLHITMDIF